MKQFIKKTKAPERRTIEHGSDGKDQPEEIRAGHDHPDVYRLVAEYAHDGILIANKNQRLYANPKYLELTGYKSQAEIMDKPFLFAVHPDDREMVKKILHQGQTGGNAPLQYTCRFLRPDGSVVHVEIWSTLIRYQGEPASLIYIRDITKRVQAEDRFSAAFYLSPVSLSFSDLDTGKLLDINEVFTTITGYGREEAIGKVITDLIIWPSEDMREKFLSLLETQGGCNGVITKMRTRDGTRKDIRISSKVLSLSGNSQLFSIIEDLTNIREQEARFTALIEKSTDVISVLDEKGLFLYNTPSVEAVFGYGPEFLIGKSAFEFIHPADRKEAMGAFSNVAAHTNTGIPTELRFLKGDGSWIHLETLGTNLLHDPGINGIVITSRDITSRKKTEEELTRLSVAIEQAAEEIVITDAEGVIQYVNPAFERITGYARDETLGRTPRLVKSGVHEPAFYENLWQTIKGGDIWTGRITNKRQDGQLIQEDVIINPLIGAHGLITGFVSLKRDVTQQIKTEGQLIHALKMESIGTLSSGIAHDFNNILSGILGQITLMLLGMNEAHPFYKKLRSIDQQVMSGANLTRQLLGFARGIQYEVKSTDINDLLNKSSEMFGRTKKGISISKKFQKDIWPVEVDQGQIDQVFLNIFINAAQAMADEGEIDLETGNVELSDGEAMPHGIHGGRYVRISVADTGTGMDQATQERIFEPFFTTKSPGMGTGLGLASAYGIIKNHGGFITVSSVPGQGSTFHIHLPATNTGIASGQEEPEAILRGYETIMIVDDEQIYLTVTKQLLENLGYRVFTAGSGQEAIAVFMEKRQQINLVILDMVMPGMGGRRTFEALRLINPELKIIIASGYSINQDVQQLLDQGCNDFIRKPYRIQELSKIIRQVI